MGIKQEIERLRFAEQTLRGEETKQKKQLIQKIEATEEQLWTMARDFAAPFAQKLQESGVVKILDDLRNGEDLRSSVEWRYDLFHPSGFFRKDPRPAVLETVFKVKINNQTYRLHGFYLKPDKFDPELSTKSLGQLQQYCANVTSTENSGTEMEECFTGLSWDYEYRGSNGSRYDNLCFSLFHRDGTYVLELTGGESFLEHSWSTKRFEQAVARAYESHSTHVEVPGPLDFGS